MADASLLLEAVNFAARKLSSSGNFDALLKDVLAICVQAVGASGGTMYLHDKERRRLQFRHVLPEEVAKGLPADIPDDFGIAGKVFRSREPEVNVFNESGDRTEIERGSGIVRKTMITVPLTVPDEDPIGVIQLINKTRGEFNQTDVIVLSTVSTISTMAYLNSRLLDESARTLQLQGMGKVAHDIKNMAFAIEATLHTAEYSVQEMRERTEAGSIEPSTQEFLETMEFTLQALEESTDMVKRYTTLMSDLSAGKDLRPTMQVGCAGPKVRHSASYLESEARSKFVRIVYDIDEDAPPMLHDEMYLFRIVQNLVSNAIKAIAEVVPEGWKDRDGDDEDTYFGDVTVRYRFAKERHILEVSDQGAGMPRAKAELILSGDARSLWGKSSGSGWGTKIVLELARTHGATVEIDSLLGEGSTFRVTFPHRTHE